MTGKPQVERFERIEMRFSVEAWPPEPYRQVGAVARLQCPNGEERRLPLFWDGEGDWVLRLSPDLVGVWHYVVESDLPALTGRKGALLCVPSARRGGICAMPGYPLHFTTQDGQPFWLYGDTNWRAFATDPGNNLTYQTVLRYLDVRAQQGFNYVHADIMGGAGIDGQQKVFFDFGLERPNVAFFRDADQRVEAMNERGITCGVVLAWTKGAEAWEAFASDEARLRYARYIVGRYSAYNVLFIVAGEWDQIGENVKPWYQAVGREIMTWDAHRRLRGIHPCQKRTVQEFASESWMSFGDYQQMYCAPDEREATPHERAALRRRLVAARIYGKPVVNGEYAYYLREMGPDHSYIRGVDGVEKPHSHTRDSFRRASWALAMAGGYFVTGFGTTYFGGWRDKGPFDVEAPKNDVAEHDLIVLQQFFTALSWWRLAVLDDLVRVDQGQGYCLAELGEVYVVYCEGTLSMTLLLDDDRPGIYEMRRHDPRTGESVGLGTGQAGSYIRIEMPDAQDWVVLARRVEPLASVSGT